MFFPELAWVQQCLRAESASTLEQSSSLEARVRPSPRVNVKRNPLDVLLASYSCLNDPEWSSDESPAYPRSGRKVAQ